MVYVQKQENSCASVKNQNVEIYTEQVTINEDKGQD